MNQEVKTAIKAAENDLEQERTQKLQTEIYQFLKAELEAVDSLEAKIRALNDEKRIHEENIKNVKSGNLEAVERRREALKQQNAFSGFTLSTSHTYPYWEWDKLIGGITFQLPNGRIVTF